MLDLVTLNNELSILDFLILKLIINLIISLAPN